MKKIMTLLLVLTLALGLFAWCESDKKSEGGTLNLFTWEGMFPQEVLDGFTADTVFTISYNNFDYDETMRQTSGGRGLNYDLVIADDYIIETVIDEALHKAGYEQASNFKISTQSTKASSMILQIVHRTVWRRHSDNSIRPFSGGY